jgi:hypothetical protein
MENGLTIIYPYYDSPDMFKVHQKEWAAWPEDLLKKTSFIVVDDCSPNKPAKNAVIPSTKALLNFTLYFIEVNLAWNWRAARNIGAHKAESSWLFMSDIDHMIDETTFKFLHRMIPSGSLDKDRFYTFDRINFVDNSPYKDHPNTYFLHRNMYMEIGGYDEVVSGMYGMDGVFRRRLERTSRGHLRFEKEGVHIIRYRKEDVDDCAAKLPRKEGRDPVKLKEARALIKERFTNNIMPKVLSYPYHMVQI